MRHRWSDLLEELGDACREGDYQRCLDILDQEYVRATADDREALRHLFRGDERLDSQVAEQLAVVSRLASAAADHRASLRACLLSVSLLYHYDSRDVLLGLEACWRWARSQEPDPSPLFREIAAISSPEPTHQVGGSAQDMILGAMNDGGRGRELPTQAG